MNIRYSISDEFRNAIKNSKLSIIKLSKKVGFEVKNVTSRNKTISKIHLAKLMAFCDLPSLQEVVLDYSSNLESMPLQLPLSH